MSPGLTGNIKLESGRRSSLQLDLMKFVAETRLVSVDIIYLLIFTLYLLTSSCLAHTSSAQIRLLSSKMLYGRRC